ncbi:uncharacterized protein LOC143461166 isoform X1 [Clavelina lepadiformis]|uniref:uncharacterized protein LOC143461166 isoform X1 n=1 Tax=Clavelina lepadiformis TaxID=159417 RepID=UPI00404179F9
MYVCEVLCLKNLFFLMWCGSYFTATNAVLFVTDYKDPTSAYKPGELSSQNVLETFLVGMLALGIALIIMLLCIYRSRKQTVRQLRERENQQRNLAFRFTNGNVVNRRQ